MFCVLILQLVSGFHLVFCVVSSRRMMTVHWPRAPVCVRRVDLNEMFAKTAEAAGSGGGRVESDYMPTFGKVVSSEGVMSSTAVSSSSALTDAVYMSQYAREATESIKNAVGVSAGAPWWPPGERTADRLASPYTLQPSAAGMMTTKRRSISTRVYFCGF